jgi:hypothetical protein
MSVIRQNHWFADGYFTKYSFPFEIELTNAIDTAFGFISRISSDVKETYFECKYYHGDTIEDAVLEVEQLQEVVSCTLYFGYDQLPNWDKKLASLPLDKFELPQGVSIYQHAETIISQSYPAVNYNFPQIHIDKIDPDTDEVYFAFEKIINNRKNGAFLINEVIQEGADFVSYNRNIMQPLPAWLHVLQKGFEDINLQLSGDILNDEVLQKKLTYSDAEYATTITQDSINIITISEDFIETGFVNSSSSQFNKYFVTQPINNPGRYRIIGKMYLHRFFNSTNRSYKIKYRDVVLASGSFAVYTISVITLNVNLVFDTLVDLNPNFITVESYQRKTEEKVIFDLNINPVRLHDFEGNPIPNIINKNEVDLTKSVADITFGDFVKLQKSWYNYGLTVKDGLAIMNKVESQINYDNAVDLSMFEVKYPLRKFKKGISFLLKFQEVDSKDYSFLPVFQNATNVVSTSFVTDDKTTTIEINALPLPLLVRNGVQTAHAFEVNSSKVYGIIYNGLKEGKNLVQDPAPMMLTSIHPTSFQKWFKLQIDGEELSQDFNCYAEKLLELKPESKVFMYGKYHLVKTINDTEVSPNVFEVNIELISI